MQDQAPRPPLRPLTASLPALALSALALSALVLSTAAHGQAQPAAPSAPPPAAASPTGAAPSPAELRVALAQARDKVDAALDNLDARLALSDLLLQVGEYRESAVHLAEIARMAPEHPQLAARLQAVLTQWRAADPPRPGQASAYADYCKAAQSPVGGARLLAFHKLVQGNCQRLETADTAGQAKLPGAPTASASPTVQAPKPGAVTQDSLLRIWALTAVGAAIFIGGGAWWTRKYRGKDTPRSPKTPS